MLLLRLRYRLLVSCAEHAPVFEHQVPVAALEPARAQETIETRQVEQRLVCIDSHHELQRSDALAAADTFELLLLRSAVRLHLQVLLLLLLLVLDLILQRTVRLNGAVIGGTQVRFD